MDLQDLVRKVLQYRGFTTISDSSTLIVRGMEDDYVVLVLRNSSEKETMDQMDIEGKKLVISLEYGMDPTGDLFWSREDFERMLGRALLEESMGSEGPSDIISSFEDAFAEHREPVARMISLSETEGLDTAITSISEFIPFHAISFSVETDEDMGAGILLVDAVDGEVYVALSPLLTAVELGTEQKKEPELSPESALSSATGHIISALSREVEEKIETGAVTVVEKRVISPPEDSIRTAYLGLVYIPTVFLEDEDGTVAVDGSGIMGFRKHY